MTVDDSIFQSPLFSKVVRKSNRSLIYNNNETGMDLASELGIDTLTGILDPPKKTTPIKKRLAPQTSYGQRYYAEAPSEELKKKFVEKGLRSLSLEGQGWEHKAIKILKFPFPPLYSGVFSTMPIFSSTLPTTCNNSFDSSPNIITRLNNTHHLKKSRSYSDIETFITKGSASRARTNLRICLSDSESEHLTKYKAIQQSNHTINTPYENKEFNFNRDSAPLKFSFNRQSDLPRFTNRSELPLMATTDVSTVPRTNNFTSGRSILDLRYKKTNPPAGFGSHHSRQRRSSSSRSFRSENINTNAVSVRSRSNPPSPDRKNDERSKDLRPRSQMTLRSSNEFPNLQHFENDTGQIKRPAPLIGSSTRRKYLLDLARRKVEEGIQQTDRNTSPKTAYSNITSSNNNIKQNNGPSLYRKSLPLIRPRPASASLLGLDNEDMQHFHADTRLQSSEQFHSGNNLKTTDTSTKHHPSTLYDHAEHGPAQSHSFSSNLRPSIQSSTSQLMPSVNLPNNRVNGSKRDFLGGNENTNDNASIDNATNNGSIARYRLDTISSKSKRVDSPLPSSPVLCSRHNSLNNASTSRRSSINSISSINRGPNSPKVLSNGRHLRRLSSTSSQYSDHSRSSSMIHFYDEDAEDKAAVIEKTGLIQDLAGIAIAFSKRSKGNSSSPNQSPGKKQDDSIANIDSSTSTEAVKQELASFSKELEEIKFQLQQLAAKEREDINTQTTTPLADETNKANQNLLERKKQSEDNEIELKERSSSNETTATTQYDENDDGDKTEEDEPLPVKKEPSEYEKFAEELFSQFSTDELKTAINELVSINSVKRQFGDSTTTSALDSNKPVDFDESVKSYATTIKFLLSSVSDNNTDDVQNLKEIEDIDDSVSVAKEPEVIPQTTNHKQLDYSVVPRVVPFIPIVLFLFLAATLPILNPSFPNFYKRLDEFVKKVLDIPESPI